MLDTVTNELSERWNENSKREGINMKGGARFGKKYKLAYWEIWKRPLGLLRRSLLAQLFQHSYVKLIETFTASFVLLWIISRMMTTPHKIKSIFHSLTRKSFFEKLPSRDCMKYLWWIGNGSKQRLWYLEIVYDIRLNMEIHQTVLDFLVSLINYKWTTSSASLFLHL